MKILKELRSYLPPEKRSRGKSNTVAAVRYALHCIQQVKANEEYYQLLMANEKQPCGLDVSCYTIQEIANITTEYTKNNMDVFAVAVSLVTGQILYISEQATVVLRCGADVFSRVRFVELLAPQDVNVFYSSTTPYRLPSWSICNGAEKSFYCRISCGRESRKELSYHPFRMTPYLIRAQLEDSGLEQLCCVLFAERVHSGYEAPRIPADKRIFTTTHTPSCLFQDVDERAVPLLGYLPQDLIGSPIILHLHPSDRPLMLAVHKKILQHGGQPFEFSPIRFCARNGEYITIDTSWSSFINPWSRKVAFIIGRHKVRMGPVNEDLFTAPPGTVDQTLQPEVQEITEQIHQLLMQPVHNSSSSGYGSLGSNGSHENPMSAASSSDSNGNINEDMKDIHVNDQFLSSIMPKLPGPAPRQYLNSRSLEDSDPGPTLNTLSEVADMNHCPLQPPVSITTIPGPGCHPSLASLPVPGPSSFPVLVPLPTATKAESVVSLTSHCSYSSTIVHVGDKKLHPEIEFEDAPAQVKAVPPEKEPCRRLGLTKEILLAHTQKEENDFLSGFMDVKKLSAFQSRCNNRTQCTTLVAPGRKTGGPDATWKKTGKNRKPKAKRVRPESWDSSSSSIPHPHRQPLTGLNTTAWSQSGTSLASYPPLPYPVLPAYTMPVFPPQPIPTPNEVPHVPTTSPCSMQPFTAPMFPPVMALPPSYTSYAPQPVQSLYPGQSAPKPHLPGLPKVKEGISWCSTPRNPQSPLLFQSRCSSPLQLNLLQLEESQKAERSELVKGVTNTISIPPHPIEEPQAESPEDGQTSDARSACSDLMDLLLHEDASCGTCSASSAVSESMTSGSHGHGTSGSQTGRTGSSLTSCSSKYFGSVDSSENNQLLKKTQGKETASTKTAIKYILQDPMWLLMANADENVMINYQIPLRDVDSILREDKEKLKCLQKLQPRFTDEQKKELGEIHSWIQRGGLPQAVEVKSTLSFRPRSIVLRRRYETCKKFASSIALHNLHFLRYASSTGSTNCTEKPQ
uniref:Period circadian protein homolog 2 n=1 Tax=Leptobrachium leishanense TaxID=445787 RepID=A0A8C5MI38_9ANUR